MQVSALRCDLPQGLKVEPVWFAAMPPWAGRMVGLVLCKILPAVKVVRCTLTFMKCKTLQWNDNTNYKTFCEVLWHLKVKVELVFQYGHDCSYRIFQLICCWSLVRFPPRLLCFHTYNPFVNLRVQFLIWVSLVFISQKTNACGLLLLYCSCHVSVHLLWLGSGLGFRFVR